MKNKVLTILLSVAIAFALWAYVVTVERTQIELTFYNVPVVMDGETVLRDRGLMITSGSDQTVDLTLSGKRSDLTKLKNSDITVLVDLTRIYEAGEKELSYDVSFPGNHDIEIVKRRPESVSVQVAQWEAKEIPVEVVPTGKPAEGFRIDEANLYVEPNSVNISGPKELIDQIAMGKIVVDMEGTRESVEQRKKITLCDSNGNPLNADLSDVLVENHMVLVRIPVLMEKEISLLLPVIPGGGLTAEDVTVEMSMNKIIVSGSPSIISKMPDTISLDKLDLSKENEDFSNREYSFTLPIGVKSNAGTTVYVSLTLPATETKELTILNEQIKVINAPEGYEASVGGKMTVTVRGKAGTLAGFDASDIQAVVDLKGSSEMGDYVIQFDIPENLHVGVIGEDQTAYVILTRKAA